MLNVSYFVTRELRYRCKTVAVTSAYPLRLGQTHELGQTHAPTVARSVPKKEENYQRYECIFLDWIYNNNFDTNLKYVLLTRSKWLLLFFGQTESYVIYNFKIQLTFRNVRYRIFTIFFYEKSKYSHLGADAWNFELAVNSQLGSSMSD